MTEQRCVVLSRHPDSEPDDLPAAEHGYVCFDCYPKLRSSLLELPAIATWLHVNIAAGGVTNEKVSGTREDPMPLRQDITDLIGPDSAHYAIGQTQPVFLLWEDGLVIGVFETWAEAAEACHAELLAAGVSQPAADLFRLNAPTDAYPPEVLEEVQAARGRWQIRPTERGGGDQRGEDSILASLYSWSRLTEAEGGFDDWPTSVTITAFARYLAGHLSWIVEQPWVDEFYEEIRHLGRTAHRVAPWRAETKRDTEPCACGVFAVVWHIGEGFTRCEKKMGGCGRVLKVTEHQMNANLPETRRAG